MAYVAEVIMPNPEISSRAGWNDFAAAAWAKKRQGASAFVKELFEHVLVLDSGAGGSITTFVQPSIGDVLWAWESEAYLTLAELGEGEIDIVAPSVLILVKPPLALLPIAPCF